MTRTKDTVLFRAAPWFSIRKTNCGFSYYHLDKCHGQGVAVLGLVEP